jgi:hypothetical protein
MERGEGERRLVEKARVETDIGLVAQIEVVEEEEGCKLGLGTKMGSTRESPLSASVDAGFPLAVCGQFVVIEGKKEGMPAL